MNSRTRTLASFFTLAMAAMLLGAFVTTQMRPEPARAWAEPAATGSSSASRAAGALGLETFRDIARSRTPGVVNINTKKEAKRQRKDPFHDFFGDDMMERFFGPQRERETQRSLGSGFIIDKDGYILTNRHVVEGADEISVTLSSQRPGDRPFSAKLVGRDARTDVALLKIESKETLTVLPLGNSEETEVGEWVMAIGNPFGLGGNSVTVGVVSFKGRALALGPQGTSVDMIQTDASINPGNSGGPLLNSKGEVIGINTLIVTGGMSQQSAGVGFAVPINVAKEILPQLRDKGKVVRGWMGVQIGSLRADLAKSYKLKDNRGAVINDVTADSPAEKAGLKPEDIVISVDGHPVDDNGDLSSYVAARAPGTTVNLKIIRGGAERTVAVTLGTFPDGETTEAARTEDSATHGLSVRDLTPEMARSLDLPRSARGVVVVGVEAGSAGEDAGLQRGDLIVTVGGEPVESVSDLERALAKAKADGVARIRFRRGGTHQITALRLE